MSKVSVHIVTWNSMRFLPEALKSIYNQTFKDFSVTIVDNASSDGVEEYLRANWPQVAFLRNFKNLGFARANNQAIGLAASRWQKQEGTDADRHVLLTNPDIIIEPDCLERLVAAADRDPRIASVGGTLMKMYEKRDGDLTDLVRSETIDTTGIRLTRYGQAIDRGAGSTDRGRHREPGEVFGLSGALVLYRYSALKDLVAVEGECFDETFVTYKEDVDLAWRLRWRGYVAWFVPDAVGNHLRGAFGSEKRSLTRAWRERRAKSSFVNQSSYRNHLWLLLKNLDMGAFLRYGLLLLPYEFFKLGYLLVFERGTIRALFQAIGGVPEMLRKRRTIMRSRKVSGKDMRKWMR